MNRWMIQIPRLYQIYKKNNQIDNFQDMLNNIFVPLFEVTLDPSSHPKLALFLEHVSGIDCVDDESRSPAPIDRHFSSRSKTPSEWDIKDNPSFKYYLFFLQSNLRVLNQLRQAKGLHTLSFRPHAGEAGEVHHLDCAFLLADGINHGINLRKSPALLYLYYLMQIGLAMSPASNNSLFLSYEKNPFQRYFKIGMNVSLSTDDPLMFHQTKEPLMEEYSIAKQLWRFTSADLCEMARNSVVQSGFPESKKRDWLGVNHIYTQHNIDRDNVPGIRLAFRRQCLAEEWRVITDPRDMRDRDMLKGFLWPGEETGSPTQRIHIYFDN